VLLELERSRRELSTRQKALLEAIRAAYLKVEIGADDGMTAALRSLTAAGYGGFARMLENLPLGGSASRSAIAQLTKAEIDILRALARGGSSTKVAADTNRSVNTVNAHVKSIMRKLGTATRHEAVSLAREQGLIL
jgi:DNA-binding NarL/FixJ family response regulator